MSFFNFLEKVNGIFVDMKEYFKNNEFISRCSIRKNHLGKVVRNFTHNYCKKICGIKPCCCVELNDISDKKELEITSKNSSKNEQKFEQKDDEEIFEILSDNEEDSSQEGEKIYNTENITIDETEKPYINSRDHFKDGKAPDLCYSDIPLVDDIDYIPVQAKKLKYEEIIDLKERNKLEKTNSNHLEASLDDTEFMRIFGMSREEFYNQKRWKQIELKKEKNLF